MKNKPQPLDLEGIEEAVINKFSNLILKNFDNCKFTQEDIKQVILLTSEELKQRLKSACEFYLRYKGNPCLFSKEQFKIKWECYLDIGCLIWNKKQGQWENYNEWLFKLAFKDVFKDGDGR